MANGNGKWYPVTGKYYIYIMLQIISQIAKVASKQKSKKDIQATTSSGAQNNAPPSNVGVRSKALRSAMSAAR